MWIDTLTEWISQGKEVTAMDTRKTTCEKDVDIVKDNTKLAVPETREENRYITPPVDIYESAAGLHVLVDLPGVEHKNIQVTVDNGILSIRGGVSVESKKSSVYSEYSLLDFFRQFQLSCEVDAEHITADLKNGVLSIKLPHAEKAKSRQIAVKSES